MMINWLNEYIRLAQATLSELQLELHCITAPPASSEQIDHCEEALGTKLSRSHRAFFQTTNGLIFRYTSVHLLDSRDYVRLRGDMKVLTLSELIEVRKSPKSIANQYADSPVDMWRDLIICGDWEDGNYIVLDPEQLPAPGEYKVLIADNDATPGYWRKHRVTAQDFEEWLRRCFESIINDKNSAEYWNSFPLMPKEAAHFDWCSKDEYPAK